MAEDFNLNDVIKELDSINESNTYSIYIPSLDKDVEFKPLQAQHTKDIIKALVDVENMQSSLPIVIFNILKSCLKERIDLNGLNIIDKQYLLLGLKLNNINTVYKQIIDDKEIELDLKRHVEEIRHFEYDFDKSYDIEDENLVLNLKLPTLQKEHKFDLYQNNLVKSTKGEQKTEALFQDVYCLLIGKFVESIEFKDKKKKVLFNELSVDTIKKLVERLPNEISHDAFNKIDELTKQINKALEYEVDGVQYTISIDNDFFVKQ